MITFMMVATEDWELSAASGITYRLASNLNQLNK
jgi:hypothetical protein